MSTMDFYETSDCQHKQHLTISIPAYRIIMGDMFNYMDGINFSGFICSLFQLLWEDSDANIPVAVQKYSDSLTREICEYADSHELKVKAISSSIKPLSDIYEEKLKKRLNQQNSSVSNGLSMKITLRKSTYFLLHGDNPDAVQIKKLVDDYYNGNYAGFLRAVLEDYASRSVFDRESIMYKDIICTLQDRISASRFTTIDYISGSGKKIRYKCKPYMIISDKEHLYHYLAGEFLSDDSYRRKGSYGSANVPTSAKNAPDSASAKNISVSAKNVSDSVQNISVSAKNAPDSVSAKNVSDSASAQNISVSAQNVSDSVYNHAIYMPQIIRISRIVKIRTDSSATTPSGKLTKIEELETEQYINLKSKDTKVSNAGGTTKLTHDKKEIIVRMGRDGLDMYKQILHLRPILEKKPLPVAGQPDFYDYSFNCSENEILNYFKNFGNKARIISPQKLADDFMWFYKRAYSEYK